MLNEILMKVAKYVDLVFLAILVAYTLFINNRSLYYDEPYYLTNVELLNEVGLGNEYLDRLAGAPGPLYSVIFWIVHPITGKNTTAIRFVNILLLIGAIVALRSVYKKVFSHIDESTPWSLGMMSIPMTYVCSGLAITEVPALFMLSISLYFLVDSDKDRIDYRWILSGLFLSLAILGRQPYLLIVLPWTAWFLYEQKNKRRFINIMLFLACILILPILVFYEWKGIVPKSGAIAGEGFINIPYLLMGFGYASLSMALVDRSFFFPFTKKHILSILIGFAVVLVVCLLVNFRQPFMQTLAIQLFGEEMLPLFQTAVTSVLITVALIFVLSAFYQLAKSTDNPLRIMLILSLLIMIASCANITHQFSSRYVFQGALFIVLVTPPGKKDLLQNLLMIAGAAIGMLSLYSYFLANN